MNKKAQELGLISGSIATLGIIMVVSAVFLDWNWLIYTGVVFVFAGGAAYKLIGI